MIGFLTILGSIAVISLIALRNEVTSGDGLLEPQLEPGLSLPAKPSYLRLDSHLNSMVEGIGQMMPEAIDDRPTLQQDTSVAVTIRLSGSIPSAIEFLEMGGAIVANIGADYIEAHVPVTLLADLEKQDYVLRVQTIIPPHPLVTSQGTLIHGSPNWNTAGFTGAGVKVGIIDSGFTGFADLMGAELPSTVVARCYTAVGIFTSGLTDCDTDGVHGTAVAEAVVDVAPDVTLYIANPWSKGDLRSSASWMVSQGVTVINMSSSWSWDGAGDGGSSLSESPLNTVDLAVAGGATWVNSAGNDALSNWFGTFSDSDSDEWIEFNAGSEVNAVELTQGEYLRVEARWDDSWGSAAHDFDLYLWDSSIASVLAVSHDQQSGISGQDPFETFGHTATYTGRYYLAMKHFSGGMPSWLQLTAKTGQSLDMSTPEASVSSPASSANPGMLAVGAASWATPNTIEPFSSQGPTRDNRIKPDIVGADRGDSVSYSPEGFAGTSQAAPHVAGLAALVLQRFPALTPVEVVSYLKSNALPRANTPNNIWGYGLAHLASVPTTLAFSTQPSASARRSPFTIQPVVVIQDSEGNILTSATDLVTLSITSGTGGASATLEGNATIQAVNGVATFTDLQIDKAGTGYTLTASSSGLTDAVSSSFNVTRPIPVHAMSIWGLIATALLVSLCMAYLARRGKLGYR